jgi:unsaturated rhamnogalacturonyl hydrolase
VAAAAEVLRRYPFQCWHYGDSVGFEGLLAADDVLGTDRYTAFVHGAIKGWIPRRRPFAELDNTAPGHAMCLAHERTGDPAIVEAALDLAEFLAGRRTIGGAFASFERAPLRRPYGDVPLDAAGEALLADPGPGYFVDTLHFDAPFLVHLGRLTGRADLVDLGAAQARAGVELLQDAAGAFHHFVLQRTGARYGYGWGRGQGWALLGLLDVLEQLPAGHPARAPLHGALRRLAAVLAETQAPDGHWGTPIDDPASFHETSTASFAAAGLARGVRLGLLDPSLLDTAARAWAAAQGAARPDGTLAGVSAAVWASTEPNHYRAVPVGFQVPWGQGPFLLAAREHAFGTAAA